MKTSWRNLCKTSWGRLEDVFKTSWIRLEDVLKLSWKRLKEVLKTFRRCLGKTSWRRLLKTYELDEYFRLDQDVLKTSVCWEDILKGNFQKTLKKSTLFLISNPFPFNGQNYLKQKGPGTSGQSLFRLWSKFRKIPLLAKFYLTMM